MTLIILGKQMDKLIDVINCISVCSVLKSGNIAHQLEFVSHQVREKLDELKRRELHRLRELVRDQIKQNGTEVFLAIIHGRGRHDCMVLVCCCCAAFTCLTQTPE